MHDTYSKISVAPMMARTHKHCRYLHRLITPHIRLYTEMATAQAIMHGVQTRVLQFQPCEHPIAAQLGGSDPKTLHFATQYAVRAGFDEINLNLGCPSPRVKKGCFGTALMASPKRIIACIRAMEDAADGRIITIKTRLGYDDCDSDAFLEDFLGKIFTYTHVNVVCLHARIALLDGLTPAQNRSVPPLNYERAYRIKRVFPQKTIIGNGGITTVEAAQAHCQKGLDGIMIGRAAWDSPFLLAELAQALHCDTKIPDRLHILEQYFAYACDTIQGGENPCNVIAPIMGLVRGLPNARKFRHLLSQQIATQRVQIKRHLDAALALVRPALGD
ncbi:MAG: tRNA dihydrouridine(20/20a) synthase DusA [Pseudomonadota bacterium]